jgi:hypothetical protein
MELTDELAQKRKNENVDNIFWGLCISGGALQEDRTQVTKLTIMQMTEFASGI